MQDVLSSLLRPTESCKTSAEILYVKKNGDRRRRLVAIISKGDEACVFVLKATKSNGLDPAATSPSSSLHIIIPVYEGFQLGVSQRKPVNLDEGGPKPAAKPGYIIKLAMAKQEVRLETHSLDTLHQLLVELKNAMTTASEKHYNSNTNSHEWVKYYEQLHESTTNQVDNKMPANVDSKVAANPFIAEDGATDHVSTKSIKEAWIARELRARESLFSSYSPITVFVGTWNVCGRPNTESLAPWLSAEKDEPDLYVVGLQEMDLSTEAYLVADPTRGDAWSAAILNGLGDKKGLYSKVASKQLVGMLIVMFAKNTILSLIQEATAESVACGILGMLGNKGATGIRIRIRDSYLCFANTHLASDVNMVDRRNADYADVCRRLAFPLPADMKIHSDWSNKHPWVSNIFDAMGSSGGPGRASLSFFDADHQIWFGDLNYRLTRPDEEVRRLVTDQNWEQLFKCDQLTSERRSRRAFGSFEEAAIAFPPSYKYDIGTSNYDSSEKKRAPAWCDRILWFRNPLHESNDWISCSSYKACVDLMNSDHKPVSALLSMQIRTIDKHKFEDAHAEIVRELDKLENESIPDVGFLDESQDVLSFGDIKFGIPVTKSILLKNKGKVVAQWRFVPKTGDVSYAKSWMRIKPPSAVMLPGDVINVDLTMLVDTPAAPALNRGDDVLDDVLIIHVVNGADKFVAVGGTWHPSCFGVDLDVLTGISNGVRRVGVAGVKKAILETSRTRHDRGNSADLEKVSETLSVDGNMSQTLDSLVPVEVRKLVEFLKRCGWLYSKELFVISEKAPELTSYLRECLDLGFDFDINALSAEVAPTDQETPSERDREVASNVDNTTLQPHDAVSSSDASDAGSTSCEKIDVTEAVLEEATAVTSNHETSDNAKGLEPLRPPPAPESYGIRAVVLSAADTLLYLVRSLPSPVMPEQYWQQIIEEGYRSPEAARRVLTSFPNEHPYEYATWSYLIRFLRTLSAARGDTNPQELADVFGPVLIKIPKKQSRISGTIPSLANSAIAHSHSSTQASKSTYSLAKTTMMGLWNSWSTASTSSAGESRVLYRKSIGNLIGAIEFSLTEVDARRRQFMMHCLIESHSGRNSSSSPTGNDGIIVMQSVS
ncbi:hypothetical protein SeMB42_g05759 [Synchytrium endobioticum]|uniref:Rho-GAP domain-containing protein n=1 Tax=Synchytrium endobioticum TaxID=286115 RepID=A0A507D3E5_9FUNG|nr:hypothetical protein SeMB42_g05759 [Synchytrium endobioticum]TPX46019.1 hypothetical protein SeLEV6574_g03488 [Synchytrium endobioticum]